MLVWLLQAEAILFTAFYNHHVVFPMCESDFSCVMAWVSQVAITSITSHPAALHPPYYGYV